jgi:hypothetical protein
MEQLVELIKASNRSQLMGPDHYEQVVRDVFTHSALTLSIFVFSAYYYYRFGMYVF